MGTKTFDGKGQGRGGIAQFTFGKHDLFWQYRTNPALRTIIDTGNYVYLDGHLCLKSPECFSIKNGVVTAKLTTESDLSKFCVARVIPGYNVGGAVVITDKRVPSKLGSQWTYLPRKRGRYRKRREDIRAWLLVRGQKVLIHEGSGAVRVRRGSYIHAKKHQTLSSIDLKTFSDFTSGGGEPPNGTFGKGVKFYIKREGITQAIPAERVGVVTDTIGRICRDTNVPPINMAVAVCIGLHLLPFESRKLLMRLGYTLDGSSPTIRAYQLLIDVFYNEEVCDCNTFLIEKGLKPLTKETE